MSMNKSPTQDLLLKLLIQRKLWFLTLSLIILSIALRSTVYGHQILQHLTLLCSLLKLGLQLPPLSIQALRVELITDDDDNEEVLLTIALATELDDEPRTYK